jgi:hypothetical protein
VLTNASQWRLYQVIFAKPIDKRLVAEVDLTTIETRKEEEPRAALPADEGGVPEGRHLELRDRQDATSRYVLAALLTCNETIVSPSAASCGGWSTCWWTTTGDREGPATRRDQARHAGRPGGGGGVPAGESVGERRRGGGEGGGGARAAAAAQEDAMDADLGDA